jgi:hypothetical protein
VPGAFASATLRTLTVDRSTGLPISRLPVDRSAYLQTNTLFCRLIAGEALANLTTLERLEVWGDTELLQVDVSLLSRLVCLKHLVLSLAQQEPADRSAYLQAT